MGTFIHLHLHIHLINHHAIMPHANSTSYRSHLKMRSLVSVLLKIIASMVSGTDRSSDPVPLTA
jgi:hypothetical protein